MCAGCPACRRRSLKKNLNILFWHADRTGATDIAEVWVDGRVFRQLAEKEARLKGEIESIVKLQKQNRAFKATLYSSALSEDDPHFMAERAELHIREEALSYRETSLVQERALLAQERSQLEAEREMLIRELRRIRDEMLSRFSVGAVLHKRYMLVRLLGRGGFSEVWKAFDMQTYTEVACKIHQLNSAWPDGRKESYVRHAVREYTIHRALQHPHIVELADVFEIDLNSFATILQYCNGEDLDALLKTRKALSEREARLIMAQLFSALGYLATQSRRIIHYDLKPGNILFHNHEVKLTDFGLSKVIESQDHSEIDLTSQGAGTYWYLPPECFETEHSARISSKVDVWSAGVIFYQILYGKRPFGHGQSQQRILADRVILNAHQVEFPETPAVSDEAKALIRACLTYRPEDRPDVDAVVQLPYLRALLGTPTPAPPPPHTPPPSSPAAQPQADQQGAPPEAHPDQQGRPRSPAPGPVVPSAQVGSPRQQVQGPQITAPTSPQLVPSAAAAQPPSSPIRRRSPVRHGGPPPPGSEVVVLDDSPADAALVGGGGGNPHIQPERPA
ncbi:putative Serine/threonine-protein kinase TOUSLED [Paratrimastix pyriformis]|uniref:Serine/threonine-protein kinase TOUSLED n=1 Tax=Paratrimastix pyriformis TaxID=342808 RepID=A0ABQ8UDN9_9EUKA|nr:putative Serine/threonine-protein kinase TOUSLED [Paratrimastix pyriformis]